jgi:hypothetical protein
MKFVEKNASIKFTLPKHPHLPDSKQDKQFKPNKDSKKLSNDDL